jgi:dTDP-4-amino-4,6-dideoxygalactose transaminase
MDVPLLDLKAQYRSIKKDLDEALLRVAESQHFILGPEVKKLEENLAKYLKAKHAVGVSSGTDALLVALMAIDLKYGDEVIIPTYSFFATAGVVARLGAVPVLVDIDPLTFNIDPEGIEKRITKKAKVIMPVHLYGQSADMAPIMEIAKKYNLKVIEDCAQAIGTQYKDGKSVGTFGDIGCFSFFPSKNLGCFGDGGLVVTNDSALAEKLSILRAHGAKPKYYHKTIGGNFRLDEIQAAVLNVKLPHLDSWSAKRRSNAGSYDTMFTELGLSQGVGRLKFDGKNRVLLPKAVYKDSGFENHHIYNQYVIRVEKRNALRDFLKTRQIGNEVYYPVPFHRQECFACLKYQDTDFPVSNNASENSLALPIYPELASEQMKYVVESILDFMKLS